MDSARTARLQEIAAAAERVVLVPSEEADELVALLGAWLREGWLSPVAFEAFEALARDASREADNDSYVWLISLARGVADEANWLLREWAAPPTAP